MAIHQRLAVFNQLVEAKFVPLFFESDIETAKSVIQACYEGGARIIEFTNRGEFALDTFAAIRRHFQKALPDLILGIGSIVDAPTAALFVAYGADFIVSPSLNPELARFCNRRKIAYLPGCATLTEISQAEELGAEIVKLFPAKVVGGKAFIKSVLAPSPWTAIMPTGGVEFDREDVLGWLNAGAVCVGLGSQLLSGSLIKAGDFDQIRERVATVQTWVNE